MSIQDKGFVGFADGVFVGLYFGVLLGVPLVLVLAKFLS